jgi:hypothetical protein
MKWDPNQQSDNVEDLRNQGQRGAGGMRRVGLGGGIGTIVLVLLAFFFGVDPSMVLQLGQAVGPTQQAPAPQAGPKMQAQTEQDKFISYVLLDTERVWSEIFRQAGQEYPEPKLGIFAGRVASACGMATSATGPFYCPADSKVYIDTSFFNELRTRYRAPGDFAQAYVLAHEIGHHIQNVTGTMQRVEATRRRMNERDSNALSVRVELQADCYAGVWAHHSDKARGTLEQGDVQEALGAASAVGDDRIQKATQGYVVPDSFTHGSAEQRMRWFKRGLETGNLKTCDTFSAQQL